MACFNVPNDMIARQESAVLRCADYENAKLREECFVGEKIFFDASVSFDGRVSCASCHNPKLAFADGLQRPLVRNRSLNLPRTPSLLDVARTAGPFFWNGRAKSLAAQAFWPLTHLDEIGVDLKKAKTFGGLPKMAKALAVFQGTMTSGRATWDAWLEGKCSSLDAQEKQVAVFMIRECTSCHQGTELRGREALEIRYQEIPQYALKTNEITYSADLGLALLRNESAQHTFLKTVPPSLRNLSLKGPFYGRFGQFKSLKSYLSQHMDHLKIPKNEVPISALEGMLEHNLKSRGEMP